MGKERLDRFAREIIDFLFNTLEEHNVKGGSDWQARKRVEEDLIWTATQGVMRNLPFAIVHHAKELGIPLEVPNQLELFAQEPQEV